MIRQGSFSDYQRIRKRALTGKCGALESRQYATSSSTSSWQADLVNPVFGGNFMGEGLSMSTTSATALAHRSG